MTTPVRIFGDECLRAVCRPVEDFALAESAGKDMRELLAKLGGAGLAAPQVGREDRIVVLNPEVAGRTCMEILLNPAIFWKSEATTLDVEGCLSIPGFREGVLRSNEIELEYFDGSGNRHTSYATGFVARCLQHEVDHLDGKLIVDYLNNDRRKRIERAMRKLRG